MKKIVVDARCIFDSGIGVYISEILTRLIKIDGYKVEIILLNEQLSKFLDLKIEVNILDIYLVDFGRYSLKNIYTLNKLLLTADVYWMPALSLTPFSKVRKIVTVHDLCPIAQWKIFGLPTAFAYWCLLGVQLVLSKNIICISKFTQSELSKYFTSFFKSKSVVVHNGLSNRLTSSSTCNAGVNYSKPYFLCVGNVKPHKNILKLVHFFLKNSSYSKSYRLVVVGKVDGFRTGIEQSIDCNECITFTGFVGDDELAVLYNNASAFIFPSFYEGFGLPILEAMSFNLPILVADIEVFKEVANDKVKYFNHYDFSDFDCGLSELLNSPLSDYSLVLDSFTWERCVINMMSIIDNENSSSK
ncbi:glycosyltransferase family 4 protein [Shewanella baltica]|uniref:glycosyltransferase family 4 protein n=1 Tax=Shewanella TaxID=22 RepID=UPI003D7ABB0F